MVFHFCSRAHVPPFPTHYCDCDWFSVRFSYHSHWCLRSLIMHRSALSSCCRLHSSSRRSSPHGFTVVQCCLPPLLPRPDVLHAARLDRARTQMDGFIFPTFFFPSIVRSSPSEFTTSRVVCYWCYSAAAVFCCSCCCFCIILYVFVFVCECVSCRFQCLCVSVVQVGKWMAILLVSICLFY